MTMKPCWKLSWLLAGIVLFPFLNSFGQPDQTELVFVGSGHKNIYAFQLNLNLGELTPTGEVTRLPAPSFLAVTANNKFLYAISEGQTEESSYTTAFRIDPTEGKLYRLNQQPTGGAGPCYVEVDQQGRNVLVANYNSGSVAVYRIDPWGALDPMSAFVQNKGSSINPQRQTGPHAHCIVTAPDDAYAFVCDLGLDKILSFKFDPLKGTLTANDLPFTIMPPGDGPRHLAFHPAGKYAYGVNEMASTITAFSYDQNHGILGRIQEISLLPPDYKGQNTAAEVAVHPSGKFVYASNRGENTIVVFACDPATGRLTFVERMPSGGKTPRNFEIDPTGSYLLAANQDSGSVAVFIIDQRNGGLLPTKTSVSVDTPMCVKCLTPAPILPPAVPVAKPVPAVPVVPENPAPPVVVPPTPETPSTALTPLTPETPSAPAAPVAPQAPAAPSAPSAPVAPAAPETPATPATPTTPGTPM